mgnify:CR=1 FL=1
MLLNIPLRLQVYALQLGFHFRTAVVKLTLSLAEFGLNCLNLGEQLLFALLVLPEHFKSIHSLAVEVFVQCSELLRKITLPFCKSVQPLLHCISNIQPQFGDFCLKRALTHSAILSLST